MRTGAATLRRRTMWIGLIAAIPVVAVFVLATAHHVGEERAHLLQRIVDGVAADMRTVNTEIRAVRLVAEGTGRAIAAQLQGSEPVIIEPLAGRTFVRPVAGGATQAEVIEPADRPEADLVGGGGVLVADPGLAGGDAEAQRIRSAALAGLAMMATLRPLVPEPAMAFSHFIAARADVMIVMPGLSTVRFLEAAGYQSVVQLLAVLRGRPYYRAIAEQPAGLRQPRWAGPYRDLFTGDATMAYAVPVETDGVLNGVVGVNLLLTRLGGVLTGERAGIPRDVYLVTDAGEVLLLRVNSGEIHVAGLGRPVPLPAGITSADLAAVPVDGADFTRIGSWSLVAHAVNGAPWRLVWVVPQGIVTRSLLSGMSIFGLLIACFLVSVAGGIALVRRVLVTPTIRFILFLDDTLSGKAPAVPEMEDPWHRWASGVAVGFSRNRDLMREATERGDHLAALIRISIDAVITFDGSGHILAFNPAAETMFGAREADVVGRTLGQVIVPRDRQAEHRALMQQLRQQGARAAPRTAIEQTLCRADGRVFPAEVAVTVIEAGNDLLLTAYVRDISVRVENERRIADLAFRDPRTGLPNRIGLLEIVDGCLAAGRPIGVAFVSLSQFNDIRLSFGHEFAEQMVCLLVRRLQAHLAKTARIGRTGSAHLVIVWEGSSAEPVSALEHQLAEPLVASGRTITLRCAVGITQVEPGRTLDAEAVLREAETAALMARPVGDGGAVVRFDPGMLAYLRRNAEIEQDLRRALQVTDELWIAFQPIISLRDGHLVAFEVLVRWRHPEFGPVSPVEFIPVAERTGLIFPLGRWIVRAAIDTLAEWAARAGPGNRPPRLAINLSARQLSDPSLEETIIGRLTATGLDPALIELEITETTLLDGSAMIVERLSRLRALGVRIAVDDFGTGYSSLGYLRTLPVDTVKIDRSFISNMVRDPAAAAIVQAVTDLCHALGLEIVAEGIEEPAESGCVRALGCDLGQGFLYSRPVPAADALTMVLNRRVWVLEHAAAS